MILESFEIENWSCIKRVAVNCLPPTGAVVLHGRNGTGKSSIIAALRACLFDFKSDSSNSTLKRWFPKNSADKPRVSVVFRCRQLTWRITKQFGTRESRLECRTAAGGWKLEADTASTAHERTCELLGCRSSASGLQQLLWLTQAEIHLPDPKKFDESVQAKLRGVLGVLQTTLDDRFLEQLRARWSNWFTARSKPGKKPELKESSTLARNLQLLAASMRECELLEKEFATAEHVMTRLQELEVRLRSLERQQQQKELTLKEHEAEYEKCIGRIDAHERDRERVEGARQALEAARLSLKQRLHAEQETAAAERDQKAADQLLTEQTEQLTRLEEHLRKLRNDLTSLHEANRDLHSRRDLVDGRLRWHTGRKQLDIRREQLVQAERVSIELERLQEVERQTRVPDEAALRALEANRRKATQLRAELEAAAIRLKLVPLPAASRGTLVIDGYAPETIESHVAPHPLERAVCRRAELVLDGWGRIAISRGEDSRNLDQIESELDELDRQFANAVTEFGIAAESAALDQLRQALAHQRVCEPEILRLIRELARLAPTGLAALRSEIDHDGRKLDLLEHSTLESWNALPSSTEELQVLAGELKETLARNNDLTAAVQKEIDAAEKRLGDAASDRPLPGGQANLSARASEAAARKAFHEVSARADQLRKQLDKMRPIHELRQEVVAAETALEDAQKRFNASRLTGEEETVRERLEAARAGVKSIERERAKVKEEFDQLTGEVRHGEGLHQRRTAAAIRVEQLRLLTERETLESEACHRLLTLFDECRDNQLHAVMGPIEQRVMGWVRLLGIRGYGALQFNDQFLPEKLSSNDGVRDLDLLDESTGTIEQIGLMVRLALGSTLSLPDDPAVAILDDPLTHSDVVRLDRMRSVLGNAAAGEERLSPPAGPLQILIFTCHPEWFEFDGARVIDLTDPNVLERVGSC